MSQQPPRRRPFKTEHKHIKLTPAGRSRIEAWANANNFNFSEAIETLALIGLSDEQSSYLIPALRATTRQGIALAFNRIARLLSDIAIESAISRSMTEGLMLQVMRELAREHPDDFEQVMRVTRPTYPPLS